jgi:hypothetical protein
MFASPTFTGTVSGVSKTHVGLGNVTNESKATMFASPTFTGTPTAPTPTLSENSTKLATTEYVKGQNYLTSVTATDVGLGNVTNESKATMFASPTFTGTVSGVSKTHVGLGNVTNESKATMFASPTFTGTPTAPTPTLSENSTKLATTEYVKGQTIAYSSLSGKPTIPSGNQIIDWTTDQGSTDIHVNNLPTIPYSSISGTPAAAQIVDWTTDQGSTDIHADNISEASVTQHQGELSITESQISDLGTYLTASSTDLDSRYYTETETNQFLNLKANLASPTFTGAPTAPTPTLSDNTTKVATTEYVKGQNYLTSVTATDVSLGNVTNESKATMFASPTFTGTVSGVSKTHVGLGNVTNESKATMFASPTFTGTVSSSAVDVNGIVEANAFRTDSSSTSYSLITRDTAASNYVLYVQSPNSGGSQKIVTFGYGSATAGQATEVFRISRGNINAYSSNLTVDGVIVGTTKNFSIKHPTKEGKRLIHSCIEGPEIAVYFRGRSQSNTIQMPDYWSGLVRLDSMTVELTAIGPNQNLYVEDIADNGEVTVGSDTETLLNYFYVVYGERKDIDKLEIEIDDTGEVEGLEESEAVEEDEETLATDEE